MENEILKRIKLNKWYLWIPVIGAIIYSIRLEFYIGKQHMDNKDPEAKKIKLVKSCKTYFSLSMLPIAAVFVSLFFIYRNTGDFGAFPWFFWVGLAFGLSQTITPLIFFGLYKMGYKKYIKALSIKK